jgi:anti-sigma regulatory factor (Ser/Thr protein kinase)
MTELSLNVLDIAQNSIKAKASLITISIERDTACGLLTISVEDNGCGMDEETLRRVVDPFYTTRTTRKVGLGIPFFKMSAELTGGSFSIESRVGKGTRLTAVYHYAHIDMMPLGEMDQTMVSLVSVNPEIDFIYRFSCNGEAFAMDTREVKQVLEGLPVNSGEVLAFIRDYIRENQSEIDQK